MRTCLLDGEHRWGSSWKLERTSECKRELKEGHRCSSTRTEAVVHDLDIRIAPAELSVDDD